MTNKEKKYIIDKINKIEFGYEYNDYMTTINIIRLVLKRGYELETINSFSDYIQWAEEYIEKTITNLLSKPTEDSVIINIWARFKKFITQLRLYFNYFGDDEK